MLHSGLADDDDAEMVLHESTSDEEVGCHGDDNLARTSAAGNPRAERFVLPNTYIQMLATRSLLSIDLSFDNVQCCLEL
jgi:hypothetical protein